MGLSYYRVELEATLFADQWFLTDPTTADGDPVEPDHFTLGISYHGAIPTRMRIGHPGEEMQFSLSAFDIPVVSRSVADVIRRIAPDAAEFFPIEIQGARGTYEIMNVLCQRDCLDESRSDFTKWTEDDGEPNLIGEYQMILSPIIDADRASGAHLFRLSRHTLALFASNVLVAELEDRPNLGVSFHPAI